MKIEITSLLGCEMLFSGKVKGNLLSLFPEYKTELKGKCKDEVFAVLN